MSKTAEWDLVAEIAKATVLEKKAANNHHRHTVHGVKSATSAVRSVSPAAVKVNDAVLEEAQKLVVAQTKAEIGASNRPLTFNRNTMRFQGNTSVVRSVVSLEMSEDEKFVAFMVMNTAELGYRKCSMFMAAIRWGLHDLPVVTGSCIRGTKLPTGYEAALIKFRALYTEHADLVRFFASKPVAFAILVGARYRDIADMYANREVPNADKVTLGEALTPSVIYNEGEFVAVLGAAVRPYLPRIALLKRLSDLQNYAYAAAGHLALNCGSFTTALEALVKAKSLLRLLIKETFMDYFLYSDQNVVNTDDVADPEEKALLDHRNDKRTSDNVKFAVVRKAIMNFRIRHILFEEIVAVFDVRVKHEAYCIRSIDVAPLAAGELEACTGLCLAAISYLFFRNGGKNEIPACFVRLAESLPWIIDCMVEHLHARSDVSRLAMFMDQAFGINYTLADEMVIFGED